jgi:predicted house-cleaning NTP pyrophosphatase (Maf/HAM1 superfamily)
MTKKSKAQTIRDALIADPKASAKDIAARLNVRVQAVYQARWEMKHRPSKKAANKTAKNPIAKAAAQAAELLLQVEPPAQGLVIGVDDILIQRGLRYGKFKDRAQLTQELKRVMVRHASAVNTTFTDSQWEALEMIAHKIARIVNGDPNHVDSWTDIAGYAKLIADELEGTER